MARVAPIAYGEIDLSVVQRNLDAVAKYSGLPVICVVKANAYGHGAEQVVSALRDHRACRGFAVARIEEALAIRASGVLPKRKGVSQALLCLGTFLASRATTEQRDLLRTLAVEEIDPVLASTEDVQALLSVEQDLIGDLGGVHLCFDTGMHREGVEANAVADAVERLVSHGVKVKTLFSHFVESEVSGSPVSARQIASFETTLASLPHGGVAEAHLANSAGALAAGNKSSAHSSISGGLANRGRDCAVRVGGALYGLDLRSETSLPMLEPAMSVRSRIVQLRHVPLGASVGYNQRWQAPRDSLVGLVAAGYADGLGPTPPELGWVEREPQNGNESVLHRVPVVGSVSMDLTSVDLTDVARMARCAPRVGDSVVLLGTASGVGGQPKIGGASITAKEHAVAQGTSLYAVTLGFCQRLPMRYCPKDLGVE